MVARTNLMPSHRIKAPQVFHKFEDTTDTHVTASPVTNELSNTITRDGAQTLHVVTATGATTELLSHKDVNEPIYSFYALVYVPDVSNISSFTIFAGSAGYAEFVIITLSSSNIVQGWNVVGGTRSTFPAATFWDAGIQDSKLRVSPQSGKNAEVYFYGFVYQAMGRPTLSITYDDGTVGQYDNAAPELDARSLSATFAVITGSVGNSSSMTTTMLQDLISRGHTVCSHTHNHVKLSTVADSVIRSEMTLSHDFLRSIGAPEESFTVFIYPNGGTNATVQSILQNEYGIKTARLVGNNVGYKDHQIVALDPVIDRQTINTYSMNRGIVGYNGQTISQLLTSIDDLITSGGSACLMIHQVLTSGATGIDLNLSDYKTILDHIVLRRD